MAKNTVQCVIAWTEEDSVVVKERRSDLGERPLMRSVKVARTALWLNRATPKDVEKARVYAAAEGYHVFTFPPSERDPRGAAARAVLAA